MKNKLDDLVNALFSQLERFNDDEFCKDAEALEKELKKAHAVAEISGEILEVNRLQLDAAKFAVTYNLSGNELPENLGIKTKRIGYEEKHKVDAQD